LRDGEGEADNLGGVTERDSSPQMTLVVVEEINSGSPAAVGLMQPLEGWEETSEATSGEEGANNGRLGASLFSKEDSEGLGPGDTDFMGPDSIFGLSSIRSRAKTGSKHE